MSPSVPARTEGRIDSALGVGHCYHGHPSAWMLRAATLVVLTDGRVLLLVSRGGVVHVDDGHLHALVRP